MFWVLGLSYRLFISGCEDQHCCTLKALFYLFDDPGILVLMAEGRERLGRGREEGLFVCHTRGGYSRKFASVSIKGEFGAYWKDGIVSEIGVCFLSSSDLDQGKNSPLLMASDSHLFVLHCILPSYLFT